jgi:gluconolactonase
MTSKLLLGLGFSLIGAAAVGAQGQSQTAPTPSNLRATADPRYKDVIAKCKTPPAAPAPRGGGAGPGGGAGRGGGAAAPTTPLEYTVTEIPGVIAAGQRWTTVYQTTGNNADGPIASEDGGLLIAQMDNGQVVKIDPKGQATVVHRDTNAGGALAMSTKGALFVVSRGLGQAVLQLAPQRRVLANTINGDPFECVGGVNDVTADSRGGVYFTMGGLFHADAKGVVTQYGKDLRTNGVMLSPDEKILYVTNGQTIVAFDVQGNGSLANQRDFAKLPAGAGDGMAVDAAGRLYVTVGGGAAGAPGVYVFSADGKPLGLIPSPRNLITVAFSGPDKKTLYGIANNQQTVDIYTIPMIAQGFRARAK